MTNILSPQVAIMPLRTLIFLFWFLFVSVSAQIPPSDWVGCWNDTNAEGLLILPQGATILPNDNYKVIPPSTSTRADRAKRWCLFYCYTNRGTLYAAVTNETICTCGVTYTMYGKLQDINSEEDCVNHQATTGNIVANLYQVKLKTCTSDSNYSHFGYSCYRYYNGSNTLSWNEANDVCRRDGGYLASINRESENNYVLSLLTAARGSPARMGCFAWIGAKNYGNGAGYQWADGHTFQYTDWFSTASTTENGCAEMICPTTPTPDHGQWTTQSNCSWVQQFICEKSDGNNPNPFTPPDIELIEFDGSVSCGDGEGLGNTSPQLEWWQTMDQTTYTDNTATGGNKTLSDSSSLGRLANYVAYTTEGEIDPAAQPTFNRPTGFGFGTSRKFMIFNGLENIVSQEPFTVSSSNVISLSAWVIPSTTDQRTAVIVSKSLSSWEHPGGEAFAYALTMHNQSVYCFWILATSACSSPKNVNSAFVHVAGVFDGSSLQLYLNGELVQTTSAGEGTTLLNNTRLPIVIGGQTPYDKTVNFNGTIDDVRVYSKVLSPSDVRYLFLCSINAPAQSFFVYANDHIAFKLYGHNIHNYQRVGFIAGDNSSCAGTPFTEGHPPHSLWTTDPSLGVAIFRGRSLVPGDASSKLTMCYTDPTSRTAYVRNVGLTVSVVSIATINGNSTEIMVVTNENGDFSGSLKIKGTGLKNTQYLVFSSLPDCGNVVMSVGLWGVNTEGTEETVAVTIPFSSGRDTLFVCWAASRAARLHGKFTGHILRFVGPRFTSRVIAKNDGTMTVNSADIMNGKQEGASFFLSCNKIDLGPNVFLTVEMGNYFDYLIPYKNSSLCDILTWQVDTSEKKHYWKYSYSPISPLSPEFQGLALRVPADVEHMGSQPGFLSDGRSTLGIWGTPWNDTMETGGCCYSRLGQTPSWGQVYRITAKKYNASNLYFPRLSNPGAIEGTVVWLYLAIFNIHTETSNDINCEWTITSDINETTVNGPCSTLYSAPAPTRTVVFTIKVRILTPGYALWPNLETTATQTVSVTPMPVPIDSQPYVPGTPITHVLRYTNPSNASDMLIGDGSDVDAFYPSDAAIEPNENQSMFCTIGNEYHYWDWLAASASSGYLGSGITDPAGTSIVQYFAFGIYSIVSQRVPFKVENTDGRCSVYIDGKSVLYDQTDYELIELRQGWHQVVIRYITSSQKTATQTTTGVKIAFYGSGLATNVDIPLGVPPLTVPFTPTSGPVTTMLGYTRNSFSNASMDTEYLYTLAQYAIPHKGFLFEEELRPDGAFRLTGNSSLDVYYYAFAIFATSVGSIQMRIDNAKGPLRVYVNHNLVLSTPANVEGETKLFGAALPQGYSQVIVKAGVVNGVEWDLKVVCDTVSDAFFYTSLEMPDVTPLDAVSFRDQPLTHALALLYLNDSTTYALPFNWSDTSNKARSDAEYSDIDVKEIPIQGEIVKPSGRTALFKWSTISSKEGQDGLFEEETDSGAYNRYYSFAIYISRFTHFVNFTVHHFSGCTVWVNGTVNFATLTNSPREGTPLTIVNASAGWARVLVKLQAVGSMQLVPLTSADDANTICVQKRFEPCTIEEVCPLGAPHPSYLPYPNPTWAAISGNQWAQVGKTEDVCSTTDTTPSASDTLYAACCGTTRPAFFQLSFVAASGFTAVGWATEAPRVNYPAPIINATFSAEQNAHIVTISPPPGGYNVTKKVEYLYSYGTSSSYPNTVYTGPFTIPAEMGSVVIMAVARIGTVLESALASYMATVKLTGTLSRSSCPTGVPCAVQMLDAHSKLTTAMAGMYVVAVDSEYPDTLTSALASSAWVTENYHSYYSPSFSQLTAIDDDSVFLMTLPNAGSYSLVVYPAGANTADVQGKLYPTLLNATQQQIEFTANAYAVPYFPLRVPEGLLPGDIVALPVPMKREGDKFTGADCSKNNCLLLLQSRHTHMYVVEPPTPNDTAFMFPDLSPAATVLEHSTARTSLDCLCTAAVGGLRLPYRRRVKYIPSVAGLMLMSTAIHLPSSGGNLSIIGVGPNILYGADAFPTLAMPPANVLVLSGSFPHPKETQAEFYCRTRDILCNAPPSLELIADNATSTTLLYRVKPAADTMGMWALRIKDTISDATFETDSGISSIVLPPAPSVEYADGPCATSSASCLQNTTLTLVGRNFNLHSKEGNEVVLWDRESGRPSSAVSCPIESVMSAADGLGGVVCRLTWAVDVNKLPLPLVLDVELVKHAMQPRRDQERFTPSSFVDTLQSLVFSLDGGRQGWSGRVGPNSPSPIPGPTSATTNPSGDGAAAKGDDKSSNNKSAIVAVAVVCSIIIAVLAGVLIFIFVRYRLQPKKGEEAEMSEVEKAFVPHHEEGLYDDATANNGKSTYAPPPPGKAQINDDEF